MSQGSVTSAGKVKGTIAHDAADADAPVKIGLYAIELGAAPTNVGAGDVSNLRGTRSGQGLVIAGHPYTERLSGQYTTAQSGTVLKSVASGKAFAITAVSVLYDHDASNIISVEVKLGSTSVAGHPGLEPGSGLVEGSGAGMLYTGGDGNDVTFDCENPGGFPVWVFVTGFQVDH